MRILFLSPEAPYPLHGGGAYRTASLIEYFARIADIDLVLISDSGAAAPLPAGLRVHQFPIGLRGHSRHATARYLRNARRALAGIPPLIDRLSGLQPEIRRVIANRRYDLGFVEHFWCAPYVDLMTDVCAQTALDLHNIESILHERCAEVSSGAVRAGHRRFAHASRKLESALLPRYSFVLATSEADAALARRIAPAAAVEVYPNSLPWIEIPRVQEEAEIVFSGNFEYHPNIDAVRFLMSAIWPRLRMLMPEIRLRLVGRGESFIRHLLPADPRSLGIDVTGPVRESIPEIARARLVIAPLRTGSGTRVKILEAWAARRAIIATPIAAEGLSVSDGANVSLAATAEQFVSVVLAVFNNTNLRRSLAENGRRTYETNYCWPAAWERLRLIRNLNRPLALHRYTGET